jgi:hypothetical protein
MLNLCLSVERKNLTQRTQRKEEDPENFLFSLNLDDAGRVAIAFQVYNGHRLSWPYGRTPVINRKLEKSWLGCGVQI